MIVSRQRGNGVELTIAGRPMMIRASSATPHHSVKANSSKHLASMVL